MRSKDINCPNCKSDNFKATGSYSQTDHHQVDFMTTYIEFKCESCGHKWEEVEESE